MRTALLAGWTALSLTLISTGRALADGAPVDTGLDHMAQVLLSKVSQSSAPLVLMADFTNPNIDGGEKLNWEIGRYISLALGRKLGHAQRVKIVDRARLGKNKIMLPMGSPQFDQLAKETGAVYLVSGTVADLGKTAGVKVSLREASNGKAIASTESEIDKIETLAKMYEESKNQ